ncbi:hypothetical protein BDY21DRAFT_422037 [Lineolata rhizophorae]|uniref:Uncharacterized protein n=1 Tax=Lineolata rhizophorae TaxID=578093 RepID=A0A6A6NYP6_9PEZI|nr:hypothetical protein BDY21DRAFT_422037 [Lineolata rhizophorae]
MDEMPKEMLIRALGRHPLKIIPRRHKQQMPSRLWSYVFQSILRHPLLRKRKMSIKPWFQPQSPQASEQEPESREDIQQTTEEPVQLPESPRRVISATEPEGEGNAQETVTQVVMLDVSPRVDSTPIEADESMDDIDDDLPISIYEADEPAEFIIVDDNGGQVIIIDSSDDEIGLDDDDSGQSPRRRAQRKRSTPQSPEMVNWASKEYKTRSAASLTAAWENMWEQWEQIRAKPDRRLAQTLYRLHKKMFKAWSYELWNKKYHLRYCRIDLQRSKDVRY